MRVLTVIYYCLSIFLFLLFEDNLPQKIRYPIFTCLEYSFFAILIFQQLKSRNQKLALVSLSASFFIFQIVYYFSTSKKKIDSIPIGFEAILIFIFIFFFLYEQLKDAKEIPINDNYFFWISIGLFLYLGGSFFIYIMADSISGKELDKYWFFTYIVEIIKNFLFTLAIHIYSKKPSKKKVNQPLPNLDFTL